MNKRNVKISVDPALIANNQYNEASGAQKQIDVGPRLLPLNAGGTPTTDATTAVALPSMGKSVAVYNNSNAMKSITFGKDGTVTAQAAGAVDANGNPGLPCAPNSWSYFSAGDCTFVIASDVLLLVFLIDDQSSLVKQS